MQGEREIKCFEFVKQKFDKWNCYGVSYENLTLLQNILEKATPNPASNDFPDFIFDTGFIEHFQITSSKENHKGAAQKIEQAKYQKRVDDDIEAIHQKINESPFLGTVEKYNWSFSQPPHSYENLKSSLEKRWSDHIDSLSKYTGDRKNGIFMIEYSECALEMCEQVYAAVKKGLRYDDLRVQQKYCWYRLSRDKEMLDYLYPYREQISFVIYVAHSAVEVIKLENIPELKKLLPWKFVVSPLKVSNKESLLVTSCPANQETATQEKTLLPNDE